MAKPFPARCKDCKFSISECITDNYRSSLNRCTNPKVIAKDSWALANGIEGNPQYSSCSEERRKKSIFAACGIKGKQWVSKSE